MGNIEAKEKRLIIFTNHFYPESFRVNDIAFEMYKRGFAVKVLTAIPDYPEGHFHKGYSLFQRRSECVNGVEVVRVPIIPRGNGKPFRMILNYASGVFFFFFYALYQALFHRFDGVFVHDTSPAFINLPALVVSKIQHIPVFHWVLDMWPESLTAGGISNPKVFSMIEKMMRRVYKNDSKILITSHGFTKLLLQRGVSLDKIVYLPNWSDAVDDSCGSVIPHIPDGFVVMYAGNMGQAQNLENVLHSALKTKSHPEIHWVFVGDGRKKPWVDDFVKEHQLETTVHLLGRFPIDAMPSFFARADVMLVSLNDELVFNLTLPARVQAYMAAAKPILGMLCGEGCDVIAKAQCGWCVPSNCVDGMAEKVIELASLPRESLLQFGRRGYQFYLENFTRELCMDIVERNISSI